MILLKTLDGDIEFIQMPPKMAESYLRGFMQYQYFTWGSTLLA